MRRRRRTMTVLVTALAFVVTAPLAAKAGGVVRDDDGERDTFVDMDYSDDSALKRLVLPAGILEGATSALLSVYAQADACDGVTGNSQRLAVNGVTVTDFNPCTRWGTASYSWATFPIPLARLTQGTTNTFRISEIAGNWGDRNAYYGVDSDNDFGRSDIRQASSYFNGDIGGELMWYLTVEPSAPNTVLLASEDFEAGSPVSFQTFAARDCTRFNTGSCSVRIAPVSNGVYTHADRTFGTPMQGATTVSFAFMGENINGDLDSHVVVQLDTGRVTLGLTEFWSPNNRVSLISDGFGSRISFAQWPTANIWHRATLVFNPTADTVTATVAGSTAVLNIPPAASRIERMEFWGVRWSSFGSPMRYDTVRIESNQPPNVNPVVGLQDPVEGRLFAAGAAQTFTVLATDGNNDDYHARIQISDAATGTVVREVDTPTAPSGSPTYTTLNPPLPGGSYRWTAYAVDSRGGQGDAATPARGFTVACPGDSDCDRLSDADELKIRTSRFDSDTDDDGLLDAWEASSRYAGSGIRLSDGTTVGRYDVFGPWGSGSLANCVDDAGDELHVPEAYVCFNRAPDPLHKDVYVEMDWQDCQRGGDCPDVFNLHLDPTHHAPNLRGLYDTITMFQQAPVSNPDGRNGVNLHITVDERLAHAPNCSQADSRRNADRSTFGSVLQRAAGRNTILAKQMAVRYVWSGHSSSDPDLPGRCPKPNLFEFGLSGYGLASLVDYDWSPFGSVGTGGDYIAATLGPIWSCQSRIGAPSQYSPGPCFRETLIPLGLAAGQGSLPITSPGIYPATVPVNGQDKAINQPLTRLMGEREQDASQQLWSRSMAHLLGHAMGLDEAAVNNKPAPAGRLQNANHDPLTPLPPDSYDSWASLRYAPGATPVPQSTADSMPNYDELANADPDRDGVREHDDNCPGVHNPDQENVDGWKIFGVVVSGFMNDAFGNACDDDIDGDGKRNPAPGAGESGSAAAVRSAFFAPGEAPAQAAADPELDLYPYDTNDDGEDNDVDVDDDGDGDADTADNCPIHGNADQADLDGDGIGDVCDLDADADAIPDGLEVTLHADPLDGLSEPEYTGYLASCSNGLDDDGDGTTDAADAGCVNADGDPYADVDDRCDALASNINDDADGDGVGDPCELSVAVVGVSSELLNAADTSLRVAFHATKDSAYDVRLGSDCGSGPVLASGSYDAGSGTAHPAQVVEVAAAGLAEGANTVRVCVTAGGETAGDARVVRRDTQAPAVGAPALTAATDTGASPSDGVTNATELALTGTTEPGATVSAYRGEEFLGTAVAGGDGGWTLALAGSYAEGAYSFTVSAVDEADNASATSAAGQVTVDRTAPATSLVDGPAEGSETVHGPVTFTFAVYEPATSECRLDGGAWAACASPYSATPAPGSHTFDVRSTDVAGNVEPVAASRSWRVLYRYSGFFAPVDATPTMNRVNAGSAVPVKFSLGGDWGLDVFAAGSPSSGQLDCGTSEYVDDVEETVAASVSGLHYDADAGQYVYVWKTDASWSGTCRALRVRLDDGTVHTAYFRFR